MMTFSIIIPMYNLENYIQETLESIMKNDLSDCELLLVDDGSFDKTIEIAEALLKQKCPCYYAIIKKENTGVSDTRNQGIAAAKGEYIIFCDGDDLFEPNLLAALRVELERDIDMVAWPYYIAWNGDKKISQKESKCGIYDSEEMMRLHLLEGYRIRLGSFAIKRERLTESELSFTKEFTFAEDMEFIMKAILSAERIQWIDEPLFCYRKRPGSLVTSFDLRRFQSSRAISRVYKYLEENSIALSDELREYIQNGLYVLHYIYSIEGSLLSIKTWKAGRELWMNIEREYSDVESNCRQKIKCMKQLPYGISSKRVFLLKLGTSFYIQMRIMMNKIRGK